MSQVESPVSRSSSTPPNCAICLGSCSNKCFSDSCMHEFCFKCLLEWSKVKAECPLCKQPFQSIIHNVKSNNEYDEHIIPPPPPVDPAERALHEHNFLYTPNPSPPPYRHQFHFRTTFTVDHGGELAIQQMLLRNPFNNHVPGVRVNLGRNGRWRRRDSSATSFRRSIYYQNLWVQIPHDLMTRYRNISPRYYRSNPEARQRLVPWLNRELNALLYENTQQVMTLVDIIMEYLLTHHIFSIQFHSLLYEYLGTKTNHFIHEFSTFMKSPYDMIAYDRNANYSVRNESPSNDVNSDFENDSDAMIVPSPPAVTGNPFQTPVLEVIEINSDSSRDSDVIIREPTPPVVVDLVDTDTDENANVQRENSEIVSADDAENVDEASRKPILPLKIRLKHKRQRRDRKSKRKRNSGRSSSASSDSSTESSSSADSARKTRRFRKKQKKSRYKCYKIYRKDEDDGSSSDSSRKNSESDSEDDLPLSSFVAKEKCKRSKKSRKKVKNPTESNNFSNCSIGEENSRESSPENRHQKNLYTPPKEENRRNNDSFNYEMEVNLNYTRMDKVGKNRKMEIKNEAREQQYDQFSAGPSSGRRLRSVIIKKERNSNLWYSRPRDYYSSDSYDE